MTKSFDLVKEAIQKNGDALFHCYVPVNKHVVKKNSRPILRNRRTGKSFPGKSTELRSAENHLINSFRLEILRRQNFKTIDKLVWAVFIFHFPQESYFNKKGELSGKLPDLSNLYELPQDCLESSQVIANDRLICSHDLSRRLPSDRYGLEVFLFEYLPDEKSPTHLTLVG